MAGFSNGVMTCIGWDFRSVQPVVNQWTTLGQIPIATGGSPFMSPGFITSTGGTISISYAGGNINIDTAGGSAAIERINVDSGTSPILPTAGAITISGGTTGLLTTGTASNAFSITGILKLINGGTNAALVASNGGIFYSTATAGAILAGTATANQMLQSGASTTPAWSTSTWPATTTINQILYSSATNVVSGLATANNGVLTTGATGIPVITSLASNGQLIIGSGSGAPAAATLTAGSGITITNAANSITITVKNSLIGAWIDESTSFAAAAGNGYFVTGTATATLPASPSQGDTIAFDVDTTSILTIQANTGQFIRLANTVSASAGTCVNTLRGDSILLVYRSSDTTWQTIGSPCGVWNVT